MNGENRLFGLAELNIHCRHIEIEIEVVFDEFSKQ